MPGTADPWGRLGLSEAELFDLLYNGTGTAGLHAAPTPDIDRFNALCVAWDRPEQQIGGMAQPDVSPEAENERRISTWRIPAPFDDFDVREALLLLCDRDDERARINLEMDDFESRGLVDLLRMMAALVAHFRDNGVVWGVGRGSSAASYALYLLGVHKVDSLRFGLDFEEFLRPGEIQEPWSLA